MGWLEIVSENPWIDVGMGWTESRSTEYKQTPNLYLPCKQLVHFC